MRILLLVCLCLLLSFSGVVAQQHDNAGTMVAMTRNDHTLYMAPDEMSEAITRLDDETSLQLLARSGDRLWLRVQTGDDRVGWLQAEDIETHFDIARLPVHPDYEVYCDLSDLVIVPPRTRHIFEAGQKRGNQPLVFAKVGDSITVARYFLRPLGEGFYDLHDCAYLQPAITAFSQEHARTHNSFATISVASNTGWTSTMTVNPVRNEQAVCQSWEAVLDCEYRLLNPSIALIMFGTNDVGAISASEFRSAMREIIMRTLERDIIPVLSTIPPRPEYDAVVIRFNDIIRALSREHNVPLMDYWQALQTLPDFGLSFDDVHPSVPPGGYQASADFHPDNLQYGYTVKNLLTLHMLERIYREVIQPAGG